jgi:hypothetical protein
MQRIPAIEAPQEASEAAETMRPSSSRRGQSPGPLLERIRRAYGGRGGGGGSVANFFGCFLPRQSVMPDRRLDEIVDYVRISRNRFSTSRGYVRTRR